MDLTWTGSQFLDPGEHLQRILAAGETIDFTKKDDTWGEGVGVAIAQYFDLPPDFVRVSAGATQMIDVLLRSLYRGLIVDVVPNFHLTATVSAHEGWNYHRVPVREPAELLPSLEPYLDRDDAIFSLSSPRNPLGYQFRLSDIRELLDRSRGTVILDEVYADFATGTALHLLREHPRLFVVRTFSKAWGLANLRIGFGASAAFAGVSGEAPRLRLMPNSTSGMAQRAVRHLLDNPATVYESIKRARRCRNYLLAALTHLPGLHVWPSDANYVCVETPAAETLAEATASAGYPIRLLHDLRGYPSDWPSGVRISVPPQPHLDTVLRCVEACHAPAAESAQ